MGAQTATYNETEPEKNRCLRPSAPQSTARSNRLRRNSTLLKVQSLSDAQQPSTGKHAHLWIYFVTHGGACTIKNAYAFK